MSMSNPSASIDAARLHETRAPELIGALAVGPSVAFVFVAMRIYTRLVLIKKHFLEDYSIVAALASAVAMSVFMGLSESKIFRAILNPCRPSARDPPPPVGPKPNTPQPSFSGQGSTSKP